MQLDRARPLLEVRRGPQHHQGKKPALLEVSLDVAPGEFVSIIGRSGAGKSTLLRCINRMIEATSGDIIFDGVNVSKLGARDLRKARTRIGMIFQHYNLVNRL